MAEPQLDPDVPQQRPSAVDGLLTVMASVGMFALAAKGSKIAVRSMPKERIEAAKQVIAKQAIRGIEALAKHPAFRGVQKAFMTHPMAGHGPLEQMVREIDPHNLGILQDLYMVSQLSGKDNKLRSSIAAEILTKYEREIPQLASGRHLRMTLSDLPKVVKGTKYQQQVEEILGVDGSNINQLASQIGIEQKQFGKLRIDPWMFVDPSNPQSFYNLNKVNPIRVLDRLERVEVGGIPIFRMRQDPRGNKLGSAMFKSRFEDGKETTNPVLKLLTKGAMDKGDLAIVGGVAWSRRSKADPFELVEGPWNKAGEAAFELTADSRRGQQFFLQNASREAADEAIYGIKGKPKSDWERVRRFFGIDIGSKTPYGRGQHGTILDDLTREPREGERLRKWISQHDPTGVVGSMPIDETRHRVGDIGARSPLLTEPGQRLFLASSDPLKGALEWAGGMAARPYYLMSKVGLNVRPGRNPLSTAFKAGAIGAGIYMGSEAIRYADYALWDMPSKSIKYAFGGFEYGRQSVMEGTGLGGRIESIEEETPGLISSPLSKALQMAGLTIAGGVIGARSGAPRFARKAIEGAIDPEATGAISKALYGTVGRYARSYKETRAVGSKAMGGIIFGTGAGGLTGLATTWGDVTATREDVAERFRGDRKVPYRASAGWMLGRDPYSGGGIRYHRESRYSTFGTAYRDVAVYGSQGDRWAYGSWLPTLQNWGGARRLLNPYFAEDRNYHTRPVPATAGHGGEFPIFGPTIGATIGTLLKPTRYRDPYGPMAGDPAGEGFGGGGSIGGSGGGQDALAAMNVVSTNRAEAALAGSYSGGTGFRGHSSEAVERMGFRQGDVIPRYAVGPTNVGQVVAQQAQFGEFYIGLRGFHMKFLRENILGSAYPGLEQPRLATSAAMTSTARGYYDVEPGGLLGMCFVGDTTIETDVGKTEIQNIKVGDRVVSADSLYHSVLAVFKRQTDELFHLTTETGRKISATPEHIIPVMVSGELVEVPICNIPPTAKCIEFDERTYEFKLVRVVSIIYEKLNNPTDVYDIEVECLHYYIAGGILVHNSELPRRLLMRPHNQPEINFIPNSLPRYLPGSLCLKPDCPVSLSNGSVIAARDVSIGDTLIGIDGNEVVVSNKVVRSMFNGELAYDITPFGKLFPITITQEHPILTVNKKTERRMINSVRATRHIISKPLWKLPSNIGPDDYVCYPIRKDRYTVSVDLSEFCQHDKFTTDWIYRSNSPWPELYEFYRKEASCVSKQRSISKDMEKYIRLKSDIGKSYRIPRVVSADEIAFLIGAYISDGYKTGNQIKFCLGHGEDGFADRIVHDSLPISYIKPHIAKKENQIIVSVSNTELSNLMNSMCGSEALSKHLPWDIIDKMSNEGVRNLLLGLYAGDGCLTQSKYKNRIGGWDVSYKTASPVLAEDIRRLWLSIGICPSIYYGVSFNPEISDKESPYYQILVSGMDLFDIEFCIELMTMKSYQYHPSEIDRRQKQKRSWFVYENYVCVKVQSCVSEYNDTVVGITTTPTHTFCIDGFVTHNSEFPDDRTFPMDFSRGDPFTKIPQGEARLPGPGRDVLHKLHGGSHYSIVDNFLVVADTVPYTQAYKIMKQEVERLIVAGHLEPEWIRKYQIAIDQAQERVQFRTFRSRRAGGRQQFTIKEAISPTEFTTYERPGQVMRMGGTALDHRSDMEMIAEFQRKGASATAAKAQAAAVRANMMNFLKEREGRRIDLTMTGQRDGVIGVEAPEFMEAVEDLRVPSKRSDLRDQGVIGQAYTGAGKLVGEAGFVGGGVLGYMAGMTRNFELAQKGSVMARAGFSLMGAAIGGIMGGWAENKFTGDLDAIEHYKRFNVYGSGYADWTSPVESFIKPWSYLAASKLGDFTPPHRSHQYKLEEYFDNLKFAKNRMLASRGADWAELQPTMVGLDYSRITSGTPGLTRAIPGSERTYFRQFAEEMDPETQVEIMETVPSYMKPIYLSIWKNSSKKDTFEHPELDQAYNRLVAPLINTPATERVSEYFSSRAVPDLSSGIWHPQISMDAIKYKAIQAAGGSPHTHGLYKTEGARIDAFQPDVAQIAEEVAASFSRTANREDYNTFAKMVRGHDVSADLYAAPSFMFHSSRGRVDIMQNDRQRYAEAYEHIARGRGVW